MAIRYLDDGTTVIRIRDADTRRGSWDVSRLLALREQLEEPQSISDFPLIRLEFVHSEDQWAIESGCIIAVRPPSIIGAAVARPQRDSRTLTMALWLDRKWRERGVERLLAEELLQRATRAEQRRLATTALALVQSLGNFFEREDGSFERFIDPWRHWRAGARAAQTLVIADLPPSDDPRRALAGADGVHFRALPLDAPTALDLTHGLPKVITLEGPWAVSTMAELLKRKGVPLNEVLAISPSRAALLIAQKVGLRTALLPVRKRSLRDPSEARDLAALRPDFIAVRQRPRGTLVLVSSGRPLPMLRRVTGRLAIRAALLNPGAHAIVTPCPSRVLALREQLARDQATTTANHDNEERRARRHT